MGSITIEQRQSANRKRANRISRHRREGLQMADGISRDLSLHELLTDQGIESSITHEMFEMGHKLMVSLRFCAKHSMYRVYHDGSEPTYIGSHTCKHKLCPVCNSERSRILRGKYRAHFLDNPEFNRKNYDFMHLTLTVPHTNGQWRGKRFYLDALLGEFNQMRKKGFWKEAVYGGEFNVEISRDSKQNGLHIHIHALLIVNRWHGNRNELYENILLEWNRRTIDFARPETDFTDTQKTAILRGLGETDGRWLFSTLDRRGSTMVSLTNLYWNEKGKRRYLNDRSSDDDFMKGILECLKYNLKPLTFELEDDGVTRIFDTDLILELLPLLKGRRLYSKFGALRGVKALNINDTDLKQDLEEQLEQHGGEVVSPTTGQPLPGWAYGYVSADAANVFGTERLRIRRIFKRLQGYLREAWMSLMEYHIERVSEERRTAKAKAAQWAETPDLYQIQAALDQ